MPAVAEAIMHRLYGHDVWEGFDASAGGSDAPAPVEGWNGDHPALKRLAAAGRVAIDVGVWKGQSTLAMAGAMREAGVDGCVIAVDTFLGSTEHWDGPLQTFARVHGAPDLYRTFLGNVREAGLAGYVVPMPQTSLAAAAILRRRGIAASVAHIDAAHDYEDVLRDAEAYWRIVEPGGYLVGDDYDPAWPGVVRAAGAFSGAVGCALAIEPPKWILRKP